MASNFFSIIIPVYKVERYLPDCVDSILNQSFADFELILVDDGSPDCCPELCDKYADKDNRIKVLHKKNGGASSARNDGLDIATGEYILFVDSDDYLCESTVLEQLHLRASLFEEEVILIGCKNLNLDGTEVVTRGNYNISLMNAHRKDETLADLEAHRNYPGSPWIMCVGRDLIEKLHLRFKLGVTAEDFEWIFRLLFNCNAIGAIDGVHYTYRRQEGSVTFHPKFSGIQGSVNAFECYLNEGKEFRVLAPYICRIYLQCILMFNKLSKDDQKKALPELRKYLHLLKDSGQWKYYYFIKLMRFHISSYCVQKAYDLTCGYGKS